MQVSPGRFSKKLKSTIYGDREKPPNKRGHVPIQFSGGASLRRIGRPDLRGLSRRPDLVSSALTQSSEPSGYPDCAKSPSRAFCCALVPSVR